MYKKKLKYNNFLLVFKPFVEIGEMNQKQLKIVCKKLIMISIKLIMKFIYFHYLNTVNIPFHLEANPIIDRAIYNKNADYYITLHLTITCFLGAPKVCEEKTEVEINGGQWITVTIKSIPAPYHVQWSKRKKEEDTFLPIDINAKEYKGTTVSFPHPVLFVKQKDQLENNCFRIEVKNFIGKTELDISG